MLNSDHQAPAWNLDVLTVVLVSVGVLLRAVQTGIALLNYLRW